MYYLVNVICMVLWSLTLNFDQKGLYEDEDLYDL